MYYLKIQSLKINVLYEMFLLFSFRIIVLLHIKMLKQTKSIKLWIYFHLIINCFSSFVQYLVVTKRQFNPLIEKPVKPKFLRWRWLFNSRVYCGVGTEDEKLKRCNSNKLASQMKHKYVDMRVSWCLCGKSLHFSAFFQVDLKPLFAKPTACGVSRILSGAVNRV